jgi:mannose-6-phosphate isomerase-like protein (cupin superfamily)
MSSDFGSMVLTAQSPARQRIEHRTDKEVQLAIATLGLIRTRLMLLSVIVVMAVPVRGNAQPKPVIEPGFNGRWTPVTIAEKKLTTLPAGPLYWEVETFAAASDAEATATSLTGAVGGKTWRFTLAPKGTATPGGTKMAEIGPIPPVEAPEYLLRVINVTGPRGAGSGVHMHPGTETFYVVSGQLTQKTQHGVSTVEAGQTMAGHDETTVMDVASSGADNLDAFVLLVLDANKKWFVPAKFE